MIMKKGILQRGTWGCSNVNNDTNNTNNNNNNDNNNNSNNSNNSNNNNVNNDSNVGALFSNVSLPNSLGAPLQCPPFRKTKQRLSSIPPANPPCPLPIRPRPAFDSFLLFVLLYVLQRFYVLRVFLQRLSSPNHREELPAARGRRQGRRLQAVLL